MTPAPGDAWEQVDALHDEMMTAYAVAEESLDRCQSTGEQADVDKHRADLRYAFRLSTAYHEQADLLVLAWQSRWWAP